VPRGRLAVAVVLGASGSVITDALGPYEVFARCGELTFRTPPRHRAPNRDLEGPRSPATEQPGIRGLRMGLPARQWRLRDACGLSRLNDFLALWSQAYMSSCNRQVTSTSIHMAKPGPASSPRGHAPL
jgi:hypothetical protein